LFIIVFSIGDITLVKHGYRIKVVFSFAAGIGPSAPVRLAGVGIGHVEKIRIFYDEETNRAKAELTAWIQSDAKIEEDAEMTINTLGLLGEKYLEIYPGTVGKRILKDNETVIGHDPVPMEKITENLKNLSDSVTEIADKLRKGEGTIGKLLTDDKVYNDIQTVTGRLSKGEGTVGKLLKEEKIYDDLEAFVADIKAHPWKLLNKPRGE
jgi:phospholipid/cholesterol/gamma-HCH transport system substrate-binding protein